MLKDLIVMKGCLEGHGKYFSYHVHITITGHNEAVVYKSEDFFKTELECEFAMRTKMPEVACFVSHTLPKLMLDPSKYVDVDEKMPQHFTRKDLY